MIDDWIRLAHVGMHPDRVRRLVSDAGTPSEVVRAVQRGAISVPAHARQAAGVPAPDRWEQLEERQITFLTRDHDDFPRPLAQLPDGPLFLFQRGSPLRNRVVAIVGTRACTAYGRRVARRYGEAVSTSGWSVVSGLARGIDAEAHRGALRGRTPPTAVLGSGIDVWYPRSNAELGREVLSVGGTVWSESPPGTPPVGWRFPPRNRIISGVAEAVVIVEAATTGGALITARTALDQGREVCATPGDIERATSAGCNLLIRDGAHPVHDAEDLIETLDLLLSAPVVGGDGASRSGGAIVSVEELVSSLEVDAATVLARVGMLEAAGDIEIRDGLVFDLRPRSRSREVFIAEIEEKKG